MTDSRNSAPRLLAGLQVGILAGLISLGWFILLSFFYFKEPWALINVFAASLRNNSTWNHSFSSVTATGISAHLTATGLIGIFLGWILPRPGRNARISLTGFTFGTILSMFVYQFFWLRFAPLLGEYIAPFSMWVAHLLVGWSLARFPRYYLKLADPEPEPQPLTMPSTAGPEPEPAAATPDASATLPPAPSTEPEPAPPAQPEATTPSSDEPSRNPG